MSTQDAAGREPVHVAHPMTVHPSTDGAGAPATTIENEERQRVTDAAFRTCQGSTDAETRRQALEAVVLENLHVARSLAAAHRGKGIPREDLEQVAYTALVAAADRFRPDEGRDFLAFAVPTIRGELKRHFRDFGWVVRPPRRVQEIHLRVLAARDRLAKDLDRVPTAAEIAADLDESEVHVSEALRVDGCFVPTSLDQPLGSGTATLGEFLLDDESRERESAEARVMLGPAVRRLRARDRHVVRLRYFDGLTQQEIGEELGVTQTQVSRILSRITRELRTSLAEQPQVLAG